MRLVTTNVGAKKDLRTANRACFGHQNSKTKTTIGVGSKPWRKSISRASNMSGMKRIFLVWSAAMSAKTIGGGTASVKLNGR